MGAHNIDFELKGKASKSEIENAFKSQRESDAAENGHQHGYSGDFQTVRCVDFKHLGEVFSDYNKAYDFCLEHAEKWETVVAVYYKTNRGEVNTLVAGWGAS